MVPIIHLTGRFREAAESAISVLFPVPARPSRSTPRGPSVDPKASTIAVDSARLSITGHGWCTATILVRARTGTGARSFSSTPAQQSWALGAIRKPVVDNQRFASVWDQVVAYDGAYVMTP
ncbi:hypothetical protein [Rhodococcus tukisamuensis]|uniref:hypothetical protein n=1 Tax=Rhodococcus tukisamuensis TaxID=168276 RepID=UPI0011143D1F|nr:hypothetical protein [Rhodococcus tukisamuensis]